LGLAFQIVDDVLDVTSTPEQAMWLAEAAGALENDLRALRLQVEAETSP
jgi:geranylgeranyl pyrophosphate synthase